MKIINPLFFKDWYSTYHLNKFAEVDDVKEIQRQKQIEENAKRNYDQYQQISEKYKSRAIEAANSDNINLILDLVNGMCGLKSKEFSAGRNMPEGKKLQLIAYLSSNEHTPTEAFNVLWQQIIKPITNQDVIPRPFNVAIESIIKHQNCPPNIIEDYSEIALKHPKEILIPNDPYIILHFILGHENLTPKTLSNLYKNQNIAKRDSKLEIVNHPNAPMDVIINCVAQNKDLINKIKNMQAVDFIIKNYFSNLDGISDLTKENLLESQSTSKETVSRITVHAENWGWDDIDPLHVAIHTNAPVDWAVAYFINNPGTFSQNNHKINNQEVSLKGWVNQIKNWPIFYADCPEEIKNEKEIQEMVEPIVFPAWIAIIKGSPQKYNESPPEFKNRDEFKQAHFNGWLSRVEALPNEYIFCPNYIRNTPEIQEIVELTVIPWWTKEISAGKEKFEDCPEDIKDRVSYKLFKIQEKKHNNSTALFMALQDPENAPL